MQSVASRLGADPDMPIRAGILSSLIERAQKNIESTNFSRRKNVLTYDDVMNQQRLLIYRQRAEVLDGKDLSETLSNMIEESIAAAVAEELPESDKSAWDFDGLRNRYLGLLTTMQSFRYTDPADIPSAEQITAELTRLAFERYRENEALFGAEVMREVERVILLHSVDVLWMDHLDAMEDLKGSVGLNSYAQRNPLNEFRIVGNDMFGEMIDQIRDRTVRQLLAQRPKEAPVERRAVATNLTAGFEGSPQKKEIRSQTPVRSQKVGRNDPCPCGSGKKYKKCCGAVASSAEE